MGITSYGSPAPFSVLPSLRLMPSTCKVWSRGVNNIISEITEWKPAPSTSYVWNTYLCAYGGLEWKGIKILLCSEFFSSHMTGDLSTVLQRFVHFMTMLMTEIGILHFLLLLKRIFERGDENERTKGQASHLCPTLLLVIFTKSLFKVFPIVLFFKNHYNFGDIWVMVIT